MFVVDCLSLYVLFLVHIFFMSVLLRHNIRMEDLFCLVFYVIKFYLPIYLSLQIYYQFILGFIV